MNEGALLQACFEQELAGIDPDHNRRLSKRQRRLSLQQYEEGVIALLIERVCGVTIAEQAAVISQAIEEAEDVEEQDIEEYAIPKPAVLPKPKVCRKCGRGPVGIGKQLCEGCRAKNARANEYYARNRVQVLARLHEKRALVHA